MGLSDERPNQPNASDRQREFQAASRAARNLAQSLIQGARNGSPMDPYQLRRASPEAPHPAISTYIRSLKPVRITKGRMEVTEEIKRHNSLVANLGVEK